MKKLSRNERLAILMEFLSKNPRRQVTLTYLAKKLNSTKSSLSEDLEIINKTLQQQKLGKLVTTVGQSGGIEFIPLMKDIEANELAEEVKKLTDDPTRVLPGGYVYLSDIISQPHIIRRFGRLVASIHSEDEIQAVVTVATKGIPIAMAIANDLNVPYVVARIGSGKVTEGPTLSTPFTTGSRQISKLELSTRSLQRGQNVLLVDDFMKNGGTIIGLFDLVQEFGATVKGVAVFAEGRAQGERKVKNFVSLMHVDSNLETGEKIKVEYGNYREELLKSYDKN